MARPPRRCGLVPAALLAALLALLPAWGCHGDEPELPYVGEPIASLLAVGDTGEEPGPVSGASSQGEVAEAMVAADRAAPVDAVVLLGDNFYPNGLRHHGWRQRLGVNLIEPYCHFLDLTDRGLGRYGEQCPPGEGRHPVPFLAVLGNHDYNQRESPMLQRLEVPGYVANWRMPKGLVELVELPGGISVVLLQSQEVVKQGATLEPLVDALRRSRGPWRILAAHHPIADARQGFAPDYARDVHEALRRSGVTVQLALAGHVHNLQVLEPPSEGGPLVVIAGGGHEAKPVRPGAIGRLFASATRGFARVDVTGEGAAQHLEVTLYAVDEVSPLGDHAAGRPVARFAVAADGSVRALEPTPPTAARPAPAPRFAGSDRPAPTGAS